MTEFQLMRALQKLPNVAEFCRRHGLPLRTVHRLRKRGNGGHEATESSRARIAAALKAEAK